MKEVFGNLWEYQADALCITTNGYTKNNGEAVMGRGCAKESTELFPTISLYLGQKLKRDGNHVAFIAAEALWRMRKECGAGFHAGYIRNNPVCGLPPHADDRHVDRYSGNPWFDDEPSQFDSSRYRPIVFFPVKHHWREQADIELIKRSCGELMELTERQGWETVVLPRPGSGNGRLSWEYVKSNIEDLLDDRIHVITFPEEDDFRDERRWG